MRVDIWSDIRCPFCYIGKRKFEKALEQFEDKENVKVSWHSFQLDPTLKTQPETSVIDYFTRVKGVSREQALQMFEGARKMGADAGVEINTESSVLANSFLAHQLLQFAKTKGLDNEIKELLFEAQFVESKNIDDKVTLIDIAVASGLSREETEMILSSGKFAEAVKKDEMIAHQIGVQGVPFFVFDKKFSVSGAQAEETFLEVLKKVKEEKNPADQRSGDF